ncbi:MAG: FkbM family methyltransferase [Rhodospirillales bacterium]|nr:FkbM family methyltransferase [Rhodospirillales bacterium]
MAADRSGPEQGTPLPHRAAPWLDWLRTRYGVARSLAIYYGKPWRFATMDRFYARFIGEGDLCFDIGAHVGNRIRSWRSLGARVIALEPQPSLMATLRLLYGRDANVHLHPQAIAREPGTVDLHLNLDNPTIGTTDVRFIDRAAQAASFHGQRWQRVIEVPATTLDRLIDVHGEPRFIKIDVEGFEAEALAGLSRPVFAVSVEFVPMAQDVAQAALDRLTELGDYRFNASYGDTMRLIHPQPLGREAIGDWLRSQGEDGPAGDIYACLAPQTLTHQLTKPRRLQVKPTAG